MSSRSVLVVDDDDFAQQVFAEMLRSLGLTQVQSAKDGRAAVRLLEGLPEAPDVLVCDVFMPDMDGFEFIEHLAARKYVGGLVLVSGIDARMLDVSRTVAVRRGLRVLGAFSKPVSRLQFATALGLATSG